MAIRVSPGGLRIDQQSASWQKVAVINRKPGPKRKALFVSFLSSGEEYFATARIDG
jgi:hypothetical protein